MVSFLKCLGYLQRKRRADGKQIPQFSFVCANGRQGSQREMNCVDSAHSLNFSPPLPEGPFNSCSGRSPPRLAFASLFSLPCTSFSGSAYLPGNTEKMDSRWKEEKRLGCQGSYMTDNAFWDLLVWYSACNPVFWEKNLRCQKYT